LHLGTSLIKDTFRQPKIGSVFFLDQKGALHEVEGRAFAGEPVAVIRGERTTDR
jgi:hypothetical protein